MSHQAIFWALRNAGKDLTGYGDLGINHWGWCMQPTCYVKL